MKPHDEGQMMRRFYRCFNDIVDKYPKQMAILTEKGQEITYQELSKLIDQCAQTLREHTIGAGDLVGIEMDKSGEFIVALMAIWSINAAMVPIDPKWPKNRKAAILKDAAPRAIITSGLQIKKGAGTPCVNHQLAYIIFTSGSSGKPKGVMVGWGGFLGLIKEQIKQFKLGANSRSLWLVSPFFDASLSDIGTTLLAGATLCIPSSNALIATQKIVTYILDKKITHMDITPSLLALLTCEEVPPT